MALPVIVMGAAGRMGTILARLVEEADDLTLAAVLERPEAEARLAGFAAAGVLVSSDIRNVLPKCPGAVIIDFTAPEASMLNARAAAENGNPIIIGTPASPMNRSPNSPPLPRRASSSALPT